MVLTQTPVPAAQMVRLSDPSAGLEGAIVIHSTALGPAAGGCRFWHYDTQAEALADAARLAEGMTYKNAMAGLPFGGGKAVLRVPRAPFDRAALFRAFARAVEALDGRYITAEDVGTTVDDMREVARGTKYVAGLESDGTRAGGDPSPWTALGVLEAMRAAARSTLGAELRDLGVAIQGVGNVGGRLARLLAAEGAQLFIADLHADRARHLADELGARTASLDDIAASAVDVFAPCALGGALSAESVPALRARLVCGGANNQLATPGVADTLLERGIAYVPDYVANAGGIISVTAEYLGEDRASVTQRVMDIGPRVAQILAEARSANLSPAAIADAMAQRLVASA